MASAIVGIRARFSAGHVRRQSSAALLVFAIAGSLQAGERKVLTIAIDGLRPDALVAANAPNVDSLVEGTFFGTGGPSGIFVTYAQSEHLTFSGPGWGAYMTGLHVDRHGADTNEFENVVPGTTDWFTPLEAFDPSLNTHRVLTWVIAHNSFPSGADTADVYEYDANGDQLMTNRVVNLMQNPATDVVMTFFSDVDVAGHTCGFDPTAACYLAEISNTDAQIGQIMSAMAARPNFANEDWLVILTTDHGGLDTGHSGGLPEQRTIPFIVAGPLATTVLPQAHPRQPDVAATVLSYFGAPIPANYDGHAVGLAPAGPAPAVFGQNLVFNGDAESNRGFDSNLLC
jgi:predicted AlkP superfamily pyrophosphatase or phosphodiesterase